MACQQKRFPTNGSNALKAEQVEFDVYVKPLFDATDDCTTIINFDEALLAHNADCKTASIKESSLNSERNTASLYALLSSFLRKSKLLGDLFSLQKSQETNNYQVRDFRIFAKGFSATGLALFLIILFGI